MLSPLRRLLREKRVLLEGAGWDEEKEKESVVGRNAAALWRDATGRDPSRSQDRSHRRVTRRTASHARVLASCSHGRCHAARILATHILKLSALHTKHEVSSSLACLRHSIMHLQK